MLKKDSILIGIIIGLAVPFVGYAIVMIIFEQLVAAGLMDPASSSISSRRMRTIGLIAICTIIIPIQFFKNKRCDKTIRGLSFPFLFYVCLWIYIYKDTLFGQA